MPARRASITVRQVERGALQCSRVFSAILRTGFPFLFKKNVETEEARVKWHGAEAWISEGRDALDLSSHAHVSDSIKEARACVPARSRALEPAIAHRDNSRCTLPRGMNERDPRIFPSRPGRDAERGRKKRREKGERRIEETSAERWCESSALKRLCASIRPNRRDSERRRDVPKVHVRELFLPPSRESNLRLPDVCARDSASRELLRQVNEEDNDVLHPLKDRGASWSSFSTVTSAEHRFTRENVSALIGLRFFRDYAEASRDFTSEKEGEEARARKDVPRAFSSAWHTPAVSPPPRDVDRCDVGGSLSDGQ